MKNRKVHMCLHAQISNFNQEVEWDAPFSPPLSGQSSHAVQRGNAGIMTSWCTYMFESPSSDSSNIQTCLYRYWTNQWGAINNGEREGEECGRVTNACRL